MLHIVFAWEIGSGFGHLTPIATLGAEFCRRGCRVTAVLRNPDSARRILSRFDITIVGMPPHPTPIRSFPISVNYTANLLRNGFWHSETVTQHLLDWQKLLEELQPNVLVCDHAPWALLASRNAPYTRAAIGNGFTLPPLTNPMSGIQPWFSLPLERLVQKDREFLEIINPALLELGIQPLKTVSSLYEGVERFLCIEAELDHYPIRHDETYLGAIDLPSPLPTPEPFWKDKSGVFIYMSATNRFLEPLMHSLKKRDISVLAYISQSSSQKEISLPQAANIDYLAAPIDLMAVLQNCRAAIIHGGTVSASLFLRHGIKLLTCPQDLEKAVLGERLKERKLGYTANWFSPQAISDQQIDELLDSHLIPASLSAFAKKYALVDRNSIVKAIVKRLL